MSIDHKIKEFDSCFRTELNNYTVPAPEGIWETISPQIGVSQAGNTIASATGKAALSAKAVVTTVISIFIVTTGIILASLNDKQEPAQKHSIVSDNAATGSITEQQPISQKIETVKHDPAEAVNQKKITAEKLRETSSASAETYVSDDKVAPVSLSETTEITTPNTPINEAHNNIAAPAVYKEKPAPAFSCITHKTANAAFSYKENEKGYFAFKTASAGNLHTSWYFDDDAHHAEGSNVTHRFSSYPGQYRVTAVATDKYGCTDTFTLSVTNHMILKPFCPNIFTPDGDGTNDEYLVSISGEEVFKLSIYDKNNRLLFETNDKNKGWNGVMPDGSRAPQGNCYQFSLTYRLAGQNTIQKEKGLIYLIQN